MKSGKQHGDKTHDLNQAIINREEGIAAGRDRDAKIGSGEMPNSERNTHLTDHRNEVFPTVSNANRESRDHNKHNHGGQDGHKKQQHTDAEEKR